MDGFYLICSIYLFWAALSCFVSLCSLLRVFFHFVIFFCFTFFLDFCLVWVWMISQASIAEVCPSDALFRHTAATFFYKLLQIATFFSYLFSRLLRFATIFFFISTRDNCYNFFYFFLNNLLRIFVYFMLQFFVFFVAAFCELFAQLI